VPNPLLYRLRAGVLAGLLCLCAGGARGARTAGSPWLARSWQTDDGLPGNVVVGVAQTTNGYLWVATEGGLSRFDGVRFREVETARTPGSRATILRTLLCGRDGNLWVGTDGASATRIDAWGATSELVTSGMPESQPVSMAQDRDGTVWMSFVNRMVCRISGGKVEILGAEVGLPGGGPCTFATDAEGQLWFAQGGHVGVFRAGRFQTLTPLPDANTRIAVSRAGGVWICSGPQLFKFEEGAGLTEASRLSSSRTGVSPAVMLEDRSGAVWIGTSTRGLFRFADRQCEHVETSHQEILSLGEDCEGDLWVGTGGGGLDRLRMRVLELQGTESGLPFESILSVCEDSEGGLWAAALNGALARWNGMGWSGVTSKAGWTGGQATCLAADRQGNVWIGTRSHGLYQWQSGHFSVLGPLEGLASQHIRGLLPASSGDLWIGMDGSPSVQRLHDGAFIAVDLPDTTEDVRAMAEDSSRRIWLGMRDGLLLRVDGTNVTDETPGNASPPSAIRCLEATPDGTLWIGYAGTGIGRLRNGRYARVGMSQGLLDGHVSQMAADDRGSLWIAGNRGIFQVWRPELEAAMDRGTARVRSIIYGRDEGLSSLQANYGYTPGATRSRDGRILFAMRTGLAVVHSRNVQDNLLPPQVVIEDMLVDGRRAAAGGEATVPAADGAHPSDPPVRLPPDNQRVDFEYTALSFVAPENVCFRYRLEGVDAGWVEAGARRVATYPRLSAGRYRFRVLACNNTGIWNETGASLGFIVRPFFWQTWWFRFSVVAAFSASLIAIVRYVSFRRLREELRVLEEQAALHRERARIAKDMHDDLGASLTEIALLSELAAQDVAAPQKAEAHIRKITGTARQVVKSLDEIVWAVNPRNDTLAHLIDYAGQYTLDFLRAPGIRCRLDLPETPPARTIPADVRHNLFLVIKEALHNVVKHAHATEVWLRAAASDEGLRISVEDNGCGFERPVEHAGADGLRNMRQRMIEIGGGCFIESRPGAGTKVIIEMPWPHSLPGS
jgi:signal transduction histidine kinase/ligand-binding sensor domain-containing protein